MKKGPSGARGWLFAGLVGCVGLGIGALAGCIPEDPGGGGLVGPACHADSDCIPNDCCGLGTEFVEKSLAPDCSARVCDNGCPTDQVNCENGMGCGIAHCSESQCVTAINPDCGG